MYEDEDGVDVDFDAEEMSDAAAAAVAFLPHVCRNCCWILE